MKNGESRSFIDDGSDALVDDSAYEDEEINHVVADENGDLWLDVKTQTPKISCRQNFTDCSNVFKAFIGSAMIGLPFAVSQAGIGLSIILLLVIAFATDHCCALIVKCKQMVIEKIIREKLEKGVGKEKLKLEADILGRTLSFGRIGKACLGRPGLLAVNISVMVTQFGFTIGYFIFLGNTMRHVIKQLSGDDNSTSINNMTTIRPVTTLLPTTTSFTTTVNATVATGFAVVSNQSIFSMLHHHLKHVVKEPFSPHNLKHNSSLTFALLLLIPLPLLVLISFVRNIRKLGPVSVLANLSICVAFAATLSYIVAQIRVDGFAANLHWFRKEKFAIFFGQVTGAFEGIGTVIPIEGSMAENRPRYPFFLHLSLFLVSCILGTFGVTGYLEYGNNVCQIITQNLHGVVPIILQFLLFAGVLFTYPLQIYPCIQITEHLIIKYRKWKLNKRKKYKVMKEKTKNLNSEDEVENLIESEEKPPEVEEVKLRTWEANIVRTILVTLTACIGLVFRSQFAYIAALTGSIGSSLLSYILPPIFHIALVGKKMPLWLKIKNVSFVLFGIAGGTLGLTVTIQEIIEAFSQGHNKHC